MDLNNMKPAELQKLAKEHGIKWGPLVKVKKELAKKLKSAEPAKTAEKPKDKAKAEKPVEKKVEKAKTEKVVEKVVEKHAEKPTKPEAAKPSPVVAAVLGLLSALGLTVSDLLGGAAGKPSTAPTPSPKAFEKVSEKLRGFLKPAEGGGFEILMEPDDLDGLDEPLLRELAKLISCDTSGVKPGQVRTLRSLVANHLSNDGEEEAEEEPEDEEEDEEDEKPAKKGKVKKIAGLDVGTKVLYTSKGKTHKAVVIDPDAIDDEDIELEDGQVPIMFVDDSSWDIVKKSKLAVDESDDEDGDPSDDEEDDEDEESDDEE